MAKWIVAAEWVAYSEYVGEPYIMDPEYLRTDADMAKTGEVLTEDQREAARFPTKDAAERAGRALLAAYSPEGREKVIIRVWGADDNGRFIKSGTLVREAVKA